MEVKRQNMYECIKYIHTPSKQLIHRAPSTTFKNIYLSACMIKKDLSVNGFFSRAGGITSLLSKLHKDQVLMPLGEEFGPRIWFLWFIWPMRAGARLAGSRAAFYTETWVWGKQLDGWWRSISYNTPLTCAWSPHTSAPLFKVGWKGLIEHPIQATGFSNYVYGSTQSFLDLPTTALSDPRTCMAPMGNLGGHSMDHPTLNTPGLIGQAAHHIAQLIRDVSPLPACDRSCLCLEKPFLYFLCPWLNLNRKNKSGSYKQRFRTEEASFHWGN